MSRWFETFFEGLYAEVLPYTFDEKQSLQQARLIKRLLKLRKGMRVLDIPCGAGRLTVPLAKMGLEMTGLDFTASFIRSARRAARKEDVKVCFIQQDMRKLDFDGEFDAAFNWFTSFGYFSDAENLAFAARVYRALKPGGAFLIEATYKRRPVAHHVMRQSEETIGGVIIKQRHRWEARTSRARSIWTFIKGDCVERHRLNIRLYNGSEMRALLRKVGFRDVRLFGYPPLGRLSRHSYRFIAIGRRPKK